MHMQYLSIEVSTHLEWEWTIDFLPLWHLSDTCDTERVYYFRPASVCQSFPLSISKPCIGATTRVIEKKLTFIMTFVSSIDCDVILSVWKKIPTGRQSNSPVSFKWNDTAVIILETRVDVRHRSLPESAASIDWPETWSPAHRSLCRVSVLMCHIVSLCKNKYVMKHPWARKLLKWSSRKTSNHNVCQGNL